MIKLKTIKLPPTLFKLDLLYYDNDPDQMKELQEFFYERYGVREPEEEFWYKNHLSTIDTGEGSELKGHTRLVMLITQPKAKVVVHECVHALFHLSQCTGVNINHQAQEWCALFTENLFEDIVSAFKKWKITLK